ncbi:MAG: hypothetical protein ACREON_01670 [Gemmatimonadaceae bacterium]
MQRSSCIVTLLVEGGPDEVLESLTWRICRGFPSLDLISSDGDRSYRLRAPAMADGDADGLRERIDRMVARLNEYHPSEAPLTIQVSIER